MRVFTVVCLMHLSLVSVGQLSSPLASLVNAERAFAKLAMEKSTKQAFSTYLSDSGLIFQAGPVLGKKFWQAQQEGNDLLLWEPVFASIAASGDLGYTTGPWEFRRSRTDTSATVIGYFVSVWKKEDGGWKVALDIGISFPPSTQKEASNLSNKQPVFLKSGITKNLQEELLQKEQEFITSQNKKGWKAYDIFMAPDARLYRPGDFPYITEERKRQLFSATDKKFSYEPVDGAVAASGDLGYVYGKTVIETTKEGNTQKVNGNYLRIWKKENDTDWKIVLDLVNIAR